jgi:outer membrane biosynthesis protein TonB
MKTLKAIISLCCVAALGAGIAALTINADAWNKKTIITINEPMQIPGATLTPGKYVFKLMDSSSNRHIVQVFNEDEKTVINTILAIPNERLHPTGKSEFGFWEVPAGSTPALRSWFYPGDNFGHEFAYPKQEATKLSSVVKEEVPSVSDEEYAKATKAPEPAPEVKAPEPQAAPPAPEVAVVETPKPVETPAAVESKPATPAPSPEPRRSEPVAAADTTLPATASPLPALGLLGFVFVGFGAALRSLRSRLS